MTFRSEIAAESIGINVSRDLLGFINEMADSYSRATGADPASFYADYYLNFQSHVSFYAPLGEALGFNDKLRILEVGSGMGTRCVLGAALWGAEFTGLEPCANTYAPLSRAIQEFSEINGHHAYTRVSKPGEESGLPSDHFDRVVSFEVLEHVVDPRAVIDEMFRVLRPGGIAFLSTCNYRSFYEGHFRALWWPVLGRRTGKVWASLLGRNGQFLEEINFITRNDVYQHLARAGFVDFKPGYRRGAGDVPAVQVSFPDGFVPEPFTRRRSMVQDLIQRPRIHRALERLGMEYKVYVTARKPLVE